MRKSARPRLKLVRGGAGAAESAPAAAGTRRVRVRGGVVERAKSRVASGYYERPTVQRRLVDCLWEELFSR